MPTAVPIADHHRPEDLRHGAWRERDGGVSARLIGIANALDGLGRGQAARLAGLASETLQRWIARRTSEGVDGLHDRPRCGRPCGPSEGQQASLLKSLDPSSKRRDRGPHGVIHVRKRLSKKPARGDA
ncbi:MAG: helix-turn-helix domain-containing protein [Geminicoccaceae bacterium]|nr:helix-turn-helix domain-containing protein [Geminicoccaceae bacterium]